MQPHEQIWPTVAQFISSAIIVVATIALVWATFRLVSATKLLAKVGEDTWKSHLAPVVSTIVQLGSISNSVNAYIQLRNSCAIPVRGCKIRLLSCSFIQSYGDNFIVNRKQIEILGVSKPVDLAPNVEGEKFTFWEAAIKALGQVPDASKSVSATEIAGLAIVTEYTHSITGQSYSYETYLQVTDLNRGTIGVKMIKKTSAMVVMS